MTTLDQSSNPTASTTGAGRLSRRSLLGGLGLAALALHQGPGLFTAVAQPGLGRHLAPLTGAADVALPPSTPYVVHASCELADDYFMTDKVVLTSTEDRVIPFVAPSGHVEAIVLSNGVLAHLRRDLTQVSGWRFTQVPTARFQNLNMGLGPVLDAAVQTDEQGNVFLACAQTYGGSYHNVVFRMLQPDGTWKDTDMNFLRDNAPLTAPLKASRTPDGQGYFYVVEPEGNICVYTPHVGWTDTLWIDSLATGGASFEDAIVLWDQRNPTGGHGAVVTLSSDGAPRYYRQTDPKNFWPIPYYLTSHTDIASLVWAGWSGSTEPYAVMQNDAGKVLFHGAYYTDTLDVATTGGTDHVAVWRSSTADSLISLDEEGYVTVVTAYGDPGKPSYTDPIRLMPDMVRIFTDPTDPSNSTVFAVDADLVLNVLSRQGDGTWTSFPVHHDGETGVEFEAWRTQLTVFDATGRTVPGATVQVTADRFCGAWMPAQHVILTDQPTRLTTNAWGKVTLSLPALQLDAPVLTAQALDTAGNPSGDPLTVYPYTDVHRYLAGAAPLAALGPGLLDGQALLDARDDAARPLLPLLHDLPAENQTDAATAVSGAIQHIASIGLGGTPSTGVAVSASIDLSGGAPVFQTSGEVGALALFATESFSSWWQSVGNDLGSAWHSVRHGAVKLKKAVTSWAEDAGNWVLQLVVDIGDGAEHLMDLVLDTAEKAADVLSSLFHQLGADLKSTWDWLKSHVLDILRDTGVNADRLQQLLSQFPVSASQAVSQIEQRTDGYFEALKQTAHTEIAGLVALVGDGTLGEVTTAPQPGQSDSSSNILDVLAEGTQDASKIIHYASGQWLLDKLINYLPDDTLTFRDDPVVDSILSDLGAVLTDAEELVVELGMLLYTTFKDAFADPASIGATQVVELLRLLDGVVDLALDLVEKLVDVVIELVQVALVGLMDVLEQSIGVLPSLLRQLLAAAGINTNLQLKHLACLAVAFPATVFASAALGSGQFFPQELLAETADGAEHPEDRWGIALYAMKFGVQVVWTLADLVIDVSGEEASTLFQGLDLACPLVMGVLSWPTVPGADGLTKAPFTSTADVDTLDFWVWATSIIAPMMFIAMKTPGRAEIPEAEQSSLEKYAEPVISCLTGTTNLVLSCLSNWSPDEKGEEASQFEKIEGVAGNIPFVLAPLGMKPVADATDNISVVIKVGADLFGNSTAAYCQIKEALEARGE